MNRSELIDYTGQLLQVERFRDYSPNGLQVEGTAEVNIIVTGVTACKPLLEKACELGADMIIVHHGYFWKGEDPRILGTKRSRLKLLLEREVNLAGYHLPLDAHPQLGNNAQLAGVLGFEMAGWFGEQSIGAHGHLPRPMPLQELGQVIEQRLGRAPLVIGDAARVIHRIAWCTGAAQDYLELAGTLGVDAFLTGEVSERTVHQARESGVAFLAAGHHATERYGVRALGEHLAQHFGLKHYFIDIDNPV